MPFGAVLFELDVFPRCQSSGTNDFENICYALLEDLETPKYIFDFSRLVFAWRRAHQLCHGTVSNNALFFCHRAALLGQTLCDTVQSIGLCPS